MASTSSFLPTTRTFLTNLISSLPSTAQKSSNPLKDLRGADKSLLLTLHVLFPNEFLPALDLLDRGLVTRLITRHVQESEKHDHSASRSADVPERAVDATRNNDAEEDVTMQDAAPPVNEDEHTQAGASSSHVTKPAAQPHQASVYYVRSAQQRSSRYGSSSSRYYDPTATSYEVRLKAWNCSCPAFAFSAFPFTLDEPQGGDQPKSDGAMDGVQVPAGTGGTGAEHFEGAEEPDWRWGGYSLGEGSVGVCKHLLACVLLEHCGMFAGFVEERVVSVEEAAGWAAGWGG